MFKIAIWCLAISHLNTTTTECVDKNLATLMSNFFLQIYLFIFENKLRTYTICSKVSSVNLLLPFPSRGAGSVAKCTILMSIWTFKSPVHFYDHFPYLTSKCWLYKAQTHLSNLINVLVWYGIMAFFVKLDIFTWIRLDLKCKWNDM